DPLGRAARRWRRHRCRGQCGVEGGPRCSRGPARQLDLAGTSDCEWFIRGADQRRRIHTAQICGGHADRAGAWGHAAGRDSETRWRERTRRCSRAAARAAGLVARRPDCRARQAARVATAARTRASRRGRLWTLAHARRARRCRTGSRAFGRRQRAGTGEHDDEKGSRALIQTTASGGRNIAPRLLPWFDRRGRHDLPWQRPRTPYRVWISEVMLQQTQVATVIPYFERFMRALPDVEALAQAGEDEVFALWSGLGYYARARNLHRAARACVARHGGELPGDFDALLELQGIGRSTAGAILALSRGAPFPILDGNVKRVLARHAGARGWPGERAVETRLWSLAEGNTPRERVADYTQAIMDLGATVCTRANPNCGECPLSADCVAFLHGLTSMLPQPRPARAPPQRDTVMLILLDAQQRVL